MVEWLEHLDCDRHGLDSNLTRATLLFPWERHFTRLSSAWRSSQAATRQQLSWHFRNASRGRLIAFPM